MRESTWRRERAGETPRPYEAPRLRRYGDVRDVTLGPSNGTGESGSPTLFRD